MPKLWDPFKYPTVQCRTIEVSQEEYDALELRQRAADKEDKNGAECCNARAIVGFLCTLEVGHKGDHIAFGSDVCCTWPQECAEPTPTPKEMHT